MENNPALALVRPNIARLKPYSSARSEFSGKAEVFLDANENPFETGLNRYPDPLAKAVKKLLAERIGISSEEIMLGNGSDEVIDLVYRIFCEPGQDEAITLPPTYGMYQVSADINNVQVVEVPLLPGFAPDVSAIKKATSPRTKVLWLCSPNNPSGNDFPKEDILELLEFFPGIVVIDEAYIDFAGRDSYAQLLQRYPRLIVMQTFSKAWGLAGIRLGMALANRDIINVFNAVKPPYNVNQLTQQAALEALSAGAASQAAAVATLMEQRIWLKDELEGLPSVERVFPSDANFLLVRIAEARQVYELLRTNGVVVRDRSTQPGCHGCLRITVGTPAENVRLMALLKSGI